MWLARMHVTMHPSIFFRRRSLLHRRLPWCAWPDIACQHVSHLSSTNAVLPEVSGMTWSQAPFAYLGTYSNGGKHTSGVLKETITSASHLLLPDVSYELIICVIVSDYL